MRTDFWNRSPDGSALVRRFRTWRAQSGFVKLWTLPVWIALGAARLAVLSLSFRRLGALMGVEQGVEPWVPLATASQQKRALQIAQTVDLVARNTPWVSNCFPRALVAGLMLRLYGVPHAIYLGLARAPDGNGLKAHAWVACGRVAVTGGVGFHAFTVVGMFVPRSMSGCPTP